MVILLLVVQGYRNMNIRYFYAQFNRDDPTVASIIATGKAIDRLTDPGDLIVARSPNKAYDTFWQQAANYHDPRIFYVSGTRGWTIGREQDDLKRIADAAGRGARFFADPLLERSEVLDAWLITHAELVWSRAAGGRIWKLHAAPQVQGA